MINYSVVIFQSLRFLRRYLAPLKKFFMSIYALLNSIVDIYRVQQQSLTRPFNIHRNAFIQASQGRLIRQQKSQKIRILQSKLSLIPPYYRSLVYNLAILAISFPQPFPWRIVSSISTSGGSSRLKSARGIASDSGGEEEGSRYRATIVTSRGREGSRAKTTISISVDNKVKSRIKLYTRR